MIRTYNSESTADGAFGGWKFVDDRTKSTEIYNAAGLLISTTSRTGMTQTFTYSDANTPANIAPAPNYLLQVRDHFGRTLNSTYNAQKYINIITLPDGGMLTYDYTDGMLSKVSYPDGQSRSYVYNESANTSGTSQPTALLSN